MLVTEQLMDDANTAHNENLWRKVLYLNCLQFIGISFIMEIVTSMGGICIHKEGEDE